MRDFLDKNFYQGRGQLEESWLRPRKTFRQKGSIQTGRMSYAMVSEYLVKEKDGFVWTSKEEALKLTMEGKLHAVIVHLKSGCVYLRPEFGSKPFQLTS